jgi:hypothetical protein
MQGAVIALFLLLAVIQLCAAFRPTLRPMASRQSLTSTSNSLKLITKDSKSVALCAKDEAQVDAAEPKEPTAFDKGAIVVIPVYTIPILLILI